MSCHEQTKLFGIISMAFIVTDQLLIIYPPLLKKKSVRCSVLGFIKNVMVLTLYDPI
jgi:hypothetical protein